MKDEEGGGSEENRSEDAFTQENCIKIDSKVSKSVHMPN